MLHMQQNYVHSERSTLKVRVQTEENMESEVVFDSELNIYVAPALETSVTMSKLSIK